MPAVELVGLEDRDDIVYLFSVPPNDTYLGGDTEDKWQEALDSTFQQAGVVVTDFGFEETDKMAFYAELDEDEWERIVANNTKGVDPTAVTTEELRDIAEDVLAGADDD